MLWTISSDSPLIATTIFNLLTLYEERITVNNVKISLSQGSGAYFWLAIVIEVTEK